MPCPVFYPIRESTERTRAGGRLPLIDEYAGFCMADGSSYTPDRDTLFRSCNHGYSQDACSRLPHESAQSCIRYSVVGRAPGLLEIVCVEESDYEPRRWHRLEYLVETAEIKGEAVTECIRAQAAAFCGSYVRHFPA